MTKIKINIEHTEKLNDALDAAQSRYRVRTVCADDIQYYVEQFETALKTKLTNKKDWNGIWFKIDAHAQRRPASYNGEFNSTHVLIERSGNKWYLTDVSREEARTSLNIYAVGGFENKGAAFIRSAGIAKQYNPED